MKKITVTISDKVFAELRTHMGLRCMSGEACGVPDAFLVKIIKAVEDGDSEVGIKMKGEKDDDIIQGDVPDSS